MRVKLAEWARSYGVHPNTAYRWFRDDTLPVAARRLASGTIVVEQQRANAAGRTVAYCRVSSHDQRDDLERQAARVSLWVSEHGLSVDEVVTEVGSGLNAKRPRLARLLADASVARIVVEHRDRLARFGVEHLAAALSAQGREILVVEEVEVDDDLVRDMTEVLTSFCARLYGRRGARNRALRALTTAKNAEVV
jgi:putative resolvase